jgi:hypothetical protein
MRVQIQRLQPLPTRIQDWCDKVATQGTGSRGSYQIYLGCVQQELAATK